MRGEKVVIRNQSVGGMPNLTINIETPIRNILGDRVYYSRFFGILNYSDFLTSTSKSFSFIYIPFDKIIYQWDNVRHNNI